jgi:hypothetical protein
VTIKTDGRWFKDELGRTLHLRGVNLGGSTKVPQTPNGATWNREGFYDHRDVSFVGKPFPLDEADEHFGRLREWGLTFLRFLVTWEAIEHDGPGIYDQDYLDYVQAVAEKAAAYDIRMFIDPHQDVWSRFSGGDGAPGWTFEALGMDNTKFGETGAAVTHQEHGDPLPRMIWPTNYAKFACATLFTLFFGGNDLAPQTLVNGVPVQEYLQRHYIDAIKQVAHRLRDLPNVVGYDTLNEPSPGYIGCTNANEIPVRIVAQGPTPTIYQGMLLAAGYPQDVAMIKRLSLRPGRPRTVRLNPGGATLWRKGVEPIWKQNGVWDLDQSGRPALLRPDHFRRVDGRTVDFHRDYFTPFVERYTRELCQVHPGALIFVCSPPAQLYHGDADHAPPDTRGLVHEPHWYDALTLYLQRYVPWLGIDARGGLRFILGRGRKRRAFAQQIKRHIDLAETRSEKVPTLIGEVGIAMNLNAKAAYRSGDFSKQVEAMDDTMQALEANMVSFTLWNYTADNTNERGDLWNDEDLSIFSRDQQTGSGDIHDGGRALQAVVRPYARKVPGEPLRLSFDIRTKEFTFEFRHNPAVEAPAEFFVPNYQYPEGYEVEAPGGRYEIDVEAQTLRYYPTGDQRVHRIRLVAIAP